MLAIVGGKGGCGKTTTALGLARAFARGGDRPLVVEADCDMPNLHTIAGTNRRPGVDAVAEGARVDRTVHRSDPFPGIDVLPAGDAAGAVDPAALERVARSPRRVLVDCPAGATEAVRTPLCAADHALVVSTADRQSLTDAAKTVRMARSVDAPVLGGVLTRVDDDADPVALEGGPLRGECPVLARIPAIAGDVLSSRVGRAAYETLAEDLRCRNI